MNEVLVECNEEEELPVPHAWRPIFKAIVGAFVQEDYGLRAGVNNAGQIAFIKNRTTN